MRDKDMPPPALDVDTALARTRDVARVVAATELLPLTQAVGRFLARDATALADLPPFDNAAMDGYALRHADLPYLALNGMGVWDEWQAGDTPTPLAELHAAKIMTGAPLPAGADCVIRQEDAGITLVSWGDPPSPDFAMKSPQLLSWWAKDQVVHPFHNVRRRGEDVAAGAVILKAGQLLTPERLGLLAGAGLSHVPVWQKVRVGMFSTGNELADTGALLGAGQIYNSNRVMIAAALALPWVTLTDYGILPDDNQAITAALARAEAENDVIITSGGMSVGTADHMLDSLARRGAELAVLKIAMRPGKPLAVARLGEALFIGLPGNPFAALVTFNQIALPVLRHVAGASEQPDSLIAAVADFDYPRSAQRREYLPVTWEGRDELGRPVLQMLGKGASARLSPPARAKGIAILPEGLERVEKGAALMVAPLPR